IFEDARLKRTEIPQALRSAYGAWLKTNVQGLSPEDAVGGVQFRHVYPLFGLRRPIVPKEDEQEKEKEKEKEKERSKEGKAKGGVFAEKVPGGGVGENRR